MRYCAYLSGEHESLPRAELLSVVEAETGGYTVNEDMGRFLVFEADRFDASRLAMTHEVGELVFRTCEDVDGLADAVPEVDGSFAVRVRNGAKEIEQEVGAIIEQASGAPVDLEEPDTVFRCHVDGEEVFVYRVLEDIDTGSFERRRSHLRPFSSPVSLHPRLARAMVNLAGLQQGETILDPMCGTGGILIEAGLAGMEVFGRDIDEEMVEGARENLHAYDVDGSVEQGDIHDLARTFDQDVDAVVADLPYGRASLEEGEALAEVFLEEAGQVTDGRIVFMSDDPEAAGLEPEFSIYVHRSLTRHMFVVDGRKG